MLTCRAGYLTDELVHTCFPQLKRDYVIRSSQFDACCALSIVYRVLSTFGYTHSKPDCQCDRINQMSNIAHFISLGKRRLNFPRDAVFFSGQPCARF